MLVGLDEKDQKLTHSIVPQPYRSAVFGRRPALDIIIL